MFGCNLGCNLGGEHKPGSRIHGLRYRQCRYGVANGSDFLEGLQNIQSSLDCTWYYFEPRRSFWINTLTAEYYCTMGAIARSVALYVVLSLLMSRCTRSTWKHWPPPVAIANYIICNADVPYNKTDKSMARIAYCTSCAWSESIPKALQIDLFEHMSKLTSVIIIAKSRIPRTKDAVVILFRFIS